MSAEVNRMKEEGRKRSALSGEAVAPDRHSRESENPPTSSFRTPRSGDPEPSGFASARPSGAGRNPAPLLSPLLPALDDADQTNEPATEWKTVPLKGVSSKIADGSHNPPPKQQSGVPMLSARNISATGIEFDEFRFITQEAFEAECKRVDLMPGDVLLTIVGSIGRVAVIPELSRQFAIQRSVAVIRPQGLDSKFCMYQLQSDRVQKWLRDHARGSAQQGVYLKTLANLPMLVASLPDQREIVAEIEKQFTRLDAGVAALHRVQANLKRYRAAFLKAACEGRLVPTEAELAKAEGRTLETGEQLLARILADRRKNWHGRGKYKELAAPNTTNLPPLPEGWAWATMPQLGELNRGKSKHRPRDDAQLYGGPYPFIQTGDVRKSNGTIRDHTQTYSEFGLQQSRLWPEGTLCITIAANIAATGILKFKACFPDSVVGFTQSGDSATTRYVEFFIRTAKEKLEQFAPATAQKNINLDVLQNVAIPLPPLAEQTRIVAEVERRLSVIEELEAAVTANLQRAVRLRQSILQRSFAG